MLNEAHLLRNRSSFSAFIFLSQVQILDKLGRKGRVRTDETLFDTLWLISDQQNSNFGS